jgi:hypothetical protein
MIIPRESLLKFKSSSKGIYTAKTESVKSLSLAIEKCLLNDNDSNRAVFDEELESRSIEKFINKIDRYLYETQTHPHYYRSPFFTILVKGSAKIYECFF